MKSKSVTNLAEATADPAIDLEPVVPNSPAGARIVAAVEPEGGALVGRVSEANETVSEVVEELAAN